MEIMYERKYSKSAKGLLVCVIFLNLLMLSSNVYAHHIRGLPHYGYSKNYPQIPTYEEIRIVDDWELTFSFIKIFETKNCDLAVYIKNLKTGKPFTETVTFHVFGENEDPEATHPFNARFDPTNTYRVGWIYEEDGIYILRILFNDGIKIYREDFRMQIGEKEFNFLWLFLPGTVIFILVLLNILKQTKNRWRIIKKTSHDK